MLTAEPQLMQEQGFKAQQFQSKPPNYEMEPESDGTSLQQWSSSQLTFQEPPPPYTDTPIPEIALEPTLILSKQKTLRLVGQYRSPDFTLYDGADHAILSVCTDSYLISHEMEFRELINGRNLFTVKRSNIGNGQRNWMYAANKPGRTGKKIFELETRSDLLSGESKPTRLVFRNKRRRIHGEASDECGDDDIGKLDAIDLRVGYPTHGRAKNRVNSKITREVFYHDHKIGEIEMLSKRLKGPEFVLNICTPGIDPTLFVIFALALDDRSMSDRRRRRRPFTRGATGIGKGPGAGLTIPLVLGSGMGW